MFDLSVFAQEVTIQLPTITEDSLGNDVEVYEDSYLVQSALVMPASTSDQVDPNQLHDEVFITVHFPKDFTARLRGARVKVYGDRVFRVLGDPLPIYGSPLEWDRSALCQEIYNEH